jgi:predicted AlkP superfamily pyrophosphatase or phosphodiesterase
MRPDGLMKADTPTFDKLAETGAFTWRARTVMPCCTLPCHTSMLRGVEPERHGITSNEFHPLVRPVPSLIESAHAHGKRTGAFYNWEQLRDLAGPGSLNVSVMYGNAFNPEADQHIAEQAARYIVSEDLDLAFVYFGWTDECGHMSGWMSDPYINAISNADRCLGTVLQALDDAGWGEDTTVLVLADHGGHDRTHGEDRDEDMLIPWILNGPSVRSGYEIADNVRIFDTCVTLAHVLGIPKAREWDGRVVTEALKD